MLYRIEPCELPCVHGNTDEHASLVPVEPDLKASFDMMRDQPVLSDWKDWQIEQWAKSIVDAALKEGT